MDDLKLHIVNEAGLSENRICSVCGKKRAEVKLLFAGGKGCVCDECVRNATICLIDYNEQMFEERRKVEGRETEDEKDPMYVLWEVNGENKWRSFEDGEAGIQFAEELRDSGTVDPAKARVIFPGLVDMSMTLDEIHRLPVGTEAVVSSDLWHISDRRCVITACDLSSATIVYEVEDLETGKRYQDIMEQEMIVI